MKSHMVKDFSKIPQQVKPRSKFRRPRDYKTTLDSDYLYPIYFDEALPGDTFNVKGNFLLRLMSALDKPIMDNIYADVFYFAVPKRLLWTNFKAFMGEQDPFVTAPTDYLVPQVTMTATTGVAEGSLWDYFGIPIGTPSDSLLINAWWSRAYNRVYNEWFRSEDLIDAVTVDLDNGPDTETDYTLLKRSKRHDYFTSCLPWPQKGEEVQIPLGTEAPVKGIGRIGSWAGSSSATVYESDGTSRNYADYIMSTTANAMALERDGATDYPTIYADLDGAISATINQFRESLTLQQYLEIDARGGTRYTEKVKNHFNVTIPDFRVQRSEFLGGGTFRININPVTQTGETGTTPQGNLSSYGNGFGNLGFVKSFVEHSVILGLINIRADLTYQQGLHKMWTRRTPEDHYFPVFANLGEQAVLNKEIYLQGTNADDEVFGYQERWAEYRYAQSLVTGQLRSTAGTPLDVWHLSQEFGSLPTLGQTFIEEAVPIDRVIAVTTEPQYVLDAYFDETTVRPMPTYSVPRLSARF